MKKIMGLLLLVEITAVGWPLLHEKRAGAATAPVAASAPAMEVAAVEPARIAEVAEALGLLPPPRKPLMMSTAAGGALPSSSAPQCEEVVANVLETLAGEVR